MARDTDFIKKEEDDMVEDDEVDEDTYKSQKDAILLAIDVSASMMMAPSGGDKKKGDKDSALMAALKCAYHLMEQRIISNPKDMMGVVLYGTQKTHYDDESDQKDEPPFPNCYVLVDLDVPAADDVRKLKALAEGDDDDEELLRPADETEPELMSKLLYLSNQVFSTKAANFTSRRLFIITDNDDPTSTNKHVKDISVIRAKDLYDLGISIELFPITHTEKKQFSTSRFYDDVVYKDVAAAEANMTEVRVSKSGDGLSLLNSLISNINSKQTAKRSLFSNLPFEIGPGLVIGVNGYNILNRQLPQRSCYVWLDGDQPQLATGETSRMTDDSAETVEKAELKKAFKFGGEYVYFSPAEQKDVKNFGAPVMRIIGFKPRASIPVWASVAKSTFIFPSEVDYVGSTRVFAALWQKLLKDDKVGIAWAVTRTNAAPRLVAIIPSRENTDEDSGTPYLPSGLWLYPLPFADDVRTAPERADEFKEASEDLKTKMRVIVQQLQLPKAMYNPLKYPNPALQWHYKILQALALEDEVPEKSDDATLPKFKAISKRAGGYIEDWEEVLKRDGGHGVMANRIKREAGGGMDVDDDDDDDDGRPAKKVKADKILGAALSDDKIRAAVETGGIGKMTVVQLKDWLTSRGLSTQGKKQDLVDRVERWVEGN